MPRGATRRSFVQMLAGAPLLAATAGGFGVRRSGSDIDRRLIKEARARPAALASVSERMDFISRALLGIRYQANTLIGGPRQPEQFVVRDDAFDCVTFCEFVLAAAMARDYGEFETALRTIRYEHGKVVWAERNHYFAEWCRQRRRERDLRAGGDARGRHHRQDRAMGQPGPAAGVDHWRSVGEPAGERRISWRTATSSASCRGGRISISSTPAW